MHRRKIFSIAFEVSSNVLFVLFTACPLKVDLHAIEAANHFTNFHSFISPLAWIYKCKLVERGAPK